jgi:hypothetical protein
VDCFCIFIYYNPNLNYRLEVFKCSYPVIKMLNIGYAGGMPIRRRRQPSRHALNFNNNLRRWLYSIILYVIPVCVCACKTTIIIHYLSSDRGNDNWLIRYDVPDEIEGDEIDDGSDTVVQQQQQHTAILIDTSTNEVCVWVKMVRVCCCCLLREILDICL